MRTADLVPSVSIDAILMQRDAMIERLRTAHRAMAECNQIAVALFAAIGWDEPTWGLGSELSLHTDYHRRIAFTDAGGVEQLAKRIDARLWSALISESGLRTFMDAEARKQWEDAIDKCDVPALTRENIEATITALHGQRREMFTRGVVALFRSLSWSDYKTNSPIFLGRRIIVRYVCDVGWSGVRWGSTDKLDDLIRVMSVLDGKPEPDHRQASARILSDLRWCQKDGPQEAEIHGYFKVRGFKNGNGHIAFLRTDLVDRMNQIIAAEFPNVLGASREAEAA